MGIVFFCQSCGARFEVDPRMAGKKGHCKKCGQYMAIPRAEEIASMAAMPALAMAGAGAVAGPASRPAAAGPRRSGPGSARIPVKRAWRRSRSTGCRPAARSPPCSPLDDADDSKPYALANPSATIRAAGSRCRTTSSRGSGGGSSAGSRSSSARSTRPPTWSPSRSS